MFPWGKKLARIVENRDEPGKNRSGQRPPQHISEGTNLACAAENNNLIAFAQQVLGNPIRPEF